MTQLSLSHNTPEYLTTAEVARMLNVSNRTIQNLIKRGRFPGTTRIDPLNSRSHYKIPAAAVREFLSHAVQE